MFIGCHNISDHEDKVFGLILFIAVSCYVQQTNKLSSIVNKYLTRLSLKSIVLYICFR